MECMKRRDVGIMYGTRCLYLRAAATVLRTIFTDWCLVRRAPPALPSLFLPLLPLVVVFSIILPSGPMLTWAPWAWYEPCGGHGFY